jgi:hypothetical protein
LTYFPTWRWRRHVNRNVGLSRGYMSLQPRRLWYSQCAPNARWKDEFSWSRNRLQDLAFEAEDKEEISSVRIGDMKLTDSELNKINGSSSPPPSPHHLICSHGL